MKCFVIMPFATEFDDVYQTIRTAVETSIPGEQILCHRLDDIKGAGRITDDLLREIQESVVCIADLTGSKPNVMWEAGYATALKKPLLFVTQDIEAIPFDIKDMRTIQYVRQSLVKTLQKPLAEAFRDTLGRYEVRSESRRIPLPPKAPYTIAVTGSMQAEPGKCHRRLESLLQPYLDERTTWYCGSYGQVDEAAIQYLIEHQQRLVVVGYHAFDISSQVLALVEKHEIPFIDASKEQLPKGLDAPSVRDLIYLTRADLLIALWNGSSAGIRELIAWYEAQQKDIIIGFI
jgi:hypothetical protein